MPKSDAASVAENFSQAVPYIGGFGLLAFIVVVLSLLKKGAEMNALVPISFFYLATLFGICYLLISRAVSLSQKRKVETTDPGIASQPAYLRPVTTAQLEEPGDMPISVTEHTTKTLDKVLVERK
ncbi:MAG: hypothetical protein H7070_02700 [Saprospiraceae bacterium]|nr:hypothetical protein [Pyrinomonadaceae bacterium]